MAEHAQAAASDQLPGGVVEANADLLASVGAQLGGSSRNESPTRRNFEDWNQLNPNAQTGIVVRNTFIDVCPLEEDSGGENDSCASPHRRNLSAPPSPTRNRNSWANEEGAQFVDSDQEEEEDPGSIPNYQWAPDGSLLKAEESLRSAWPQAPSGSGSPKKVPGKPRKHVAPEDSSKLSDILASGMSLAGMHGEAASDPYAAYGLAPATGGDAGSRMTGTELPAGLGSIFGQGGGLGGFGMSGSGPSGGMDPRGLSTMPQGYNFGDAYGGNPGFGGPGASALGGFDVTGLGSLSLPPADQLLGGLPGGGLAGYGGFGHVGRDIPAPPPPQAPPLGLSSQVLSTERLATAPPLSSGPPPSPPPAELAPGAAYISDNPPPRTPLADRISTEAPAYVLGTTSGTGGNVAPLLSSNPPPPPPGDSQSQAGAGSRRPSMHSVKGDGKGQGGKPSPVDLKGMFGGMGVDSFGGRAGPEGMFGGMGVDPYSSQPGPEGMPGGYPLGAIGVPPDFPPGGRGPPGDAADRYAAESAAAYMDMSGAGAAPYLDVQAGKGSSGPWVSAGKGGHGPWIAGGALRGLEFGEGGGGGGGGKGRGKSQGGLDYEGGGAGRGRGGKGQGGRGAGRGPGERAAGADGEAKGRVPLSGGGPKRTDYIKKYGGPQEGVGVESASSSGSVPITTVMLKNIPCRKSQEEVMMHIDQKGFGNRYDFFYLPRDVKFRANLGYAFINFLTPEDASNFTKEMNGYRFSSSGSMKACAVVPAHVQGLMNNLAAFKRTEVMRSSRRPYFMTSMINL